MPRLPLPRRLLAVPAALALFGGGYFAGQHHATPAADAQFGSDYCSYKVTTEYFSGGSYSRVVGYVARWNSYRGEWESVLFGAAYAVGSFNCKQEY